MGSKEWRFWKKREVLAMDGGIVRSVHRRRPAVPIDDVATQPEQPAGDQQPPSSDPSISATPLSEADVLWSLQSADAKDLDEMVPAVAGLPAPGQDPAAFATELKNQQVDRAYNEFTSTMVTLDIANIDPAASFDTFVQGPAAWKYVDGRAPPIVDDANQASA